MFMKKSMFTKIYIIPLLFISPLLSISCNSWFSIWMTMEFNMMTFISFLIMFNKFNKEISIKYFIVQSISSSMLLLVSNQILHFMNFYIEFNYLIMSLNICLLIKLGCPPFHSWFINLMTKMSWLNCLMLSTWQKIIPLISLTYIYNKKLIYLIILISSLIGAMFGINHQSIRILLSYSSINHLSWMLMNLLLSEWMLFMYFFSYMIMNISIMNMLNYFKIFYINQLFFFNNKINKFIILINFFSISGLPPLFGFLIKWMTMYYSIKILNSPIILIIIMLSILTFLYYTQLSISLMMNMNLSNKLFMLNKSNPKKKLMIYLFTSFIQFINLWFISFWMI